MCVPSIQRNPNFIGMACCLSSVSWLGFRPITNESAALKSRTAIRAAQCKYREGETLLVPPFLGSTLCINLETSQSVALRTAGASLAGFFPDSRSPARFGQLGCMHRRRKRGAL